MPPVGFEPTILAGERLKTYALDRTVIATGNISGVCKNFITHKLSGMQGGTFGSTLLLIHTGKQVPRVV